jgi:phospholipid transport system transporter-binding protein
MLQLPATLVHSTAAASLTTLLQAMAAEPAARVAVAGASLVRFDSTALAVLLELRRVALRAGKSLVLQGMPSRLSDLASLYGIAELLPAHDAAAR